MTWNVTVWNCLAFSIRTTHAAESEVDRDEKWRKAMLDCVGEVGVDIPCYGESFPEEE